jgi:hypothetical protein
VHGFIASVFSSRLLFSSRFDLFAQDSSSSSGSSSSRSSQRNLPPVYQCRFPRAPAQRPAWEHRLLELGIVNLRIMHRGGATKVHNIFVDMSGQPGQQSFVSAINTRVKYRRFDGQFPREDGKPCFQHSLSAGIYV